MGLYAWQMWHGRAPRQGSDTSVVPPSAATFYLAMTERGELWERERQEKKNEFAIFKVQMSQIMFCFVFLLWAGQNGNWLTFGGNITENSWNKSDRWPNLCAHWGQVFTMKSVASGLKHRFRRQVRHDKTQRATDLHLSKAQEKKSSTAMLRGRNRGQSSRNKDDHITEEEWNRIHKLTRIVRKS